LCIFPLMSFEFPALAVTNSARDDTAQPLGTKSVPTL
jgi:hypothetical protein